MSQFPNISDNQVSAKLRNLMIAYDATCPVFVFNNFKYIDIEDADNNAYMYCQ